MGSGIGDYDQDTMLVELMMIVDYGKPQSIIQRQDGLHVFTTFHVVNQPSSQKRV